MSKAEQGLAGTIRNLGNRLRLRNSLRLSSVVLRKKTQPIDVRRNEQRNPSTYDGKRIYPTNFRANPFYSVLIRERGITLVELLVAVALLSLIMVAFYTVFKGGTKAYQTGEERVELIQNARIALDMMASQIRQALPEDDDANPPIVFEIEGGTSKSGPQIRFSAPIDSTEGAEEITFYLDGSNYTLYKRYDNPWAKGSDPGATSRQITAALPGAAGVVSYLWFNEKEPVGAARSGMIMITLALRADPTDTSENPFTLYTIVKSGFCYGVGESGEF